MKLRSFRGRRALSPGRVSAEPEDFAEVDEQAAFVRVPVGEKNPRLGEAASQFRRVGDAGWLPFRCLERGPAFQSIALTRRRRQENVAQEDAAQASHRSGYSN